MVEYMMMTYLPPIYADLLFFDRLFGIEKSALDVSNLKSLQVLRSSMLLWDLQQMGQKQLKRPSGAVHYRLILLQYHGMVHV